MSQEAVTGREFTGFSDCRRAMVEHAPILWTCDEASRNPQDSPPNHLNPFPFLHH